jgi:2-polyprenyl-6-methoxyphenol hydroxylase-like FAD-dependent oxidoreductase
MQSQTQVLIVGAGPTGLSMAIELERYGIACRILDKQIKPVSTSNALVAQTRTLEVWDDIGLIEKALACGIPLKGGNFFSKNKQIADLDFNNLESYYQFVLGISQHQTEEMLLSFLKDKGITVAMSTNLLDLSIYPTHVLTTVSRPDGTEEQIKSQWLVACDGGRSWIREKCHIPFEGKELPQHFVLADVEITSELMHDKLNMFTSPKGILAIIQFDKKYSRIIAEVTGDAELQKAKSLTFAQVKRLVEERCPFSVEIKEPVWTSGFWIHERLAKDFQVKRVFFAGDAAHIHSPAGGQGMNTGIQDVNNLAWKLAAVIQGKSPESILKTYTQERQAVARQVLKSTTLLTKIMTLRNPLLQYIRNWLIATLANSKKYQIKITNTLTQLLIQYQENMLVKDYLGDQAGPKSGSRMLDVNLNQITPSNATPHPQPSRLFDLVRGTQMVLLCFMGLDDGADIAVYYDFKKTLEKRFCTKMKFILIRTKNEFVDWQDVSLFDQDGRVHEKYGADKACLYLIRPDKYIGCRAGIHELDKVNKWLMQIIQ